MLHSRYILRAMGLVFVALLLGCGCRNATATKIAPAPILTIAQAESPGATARPAATPTPEPRIVTLTVAPVTAAPTNTPTAPPTPVPTAEPTATPTATPDGLCGGRFPGKFTPTEEVSENSYQSPDVAIFLTKVYDDTSFSSFVTYFVADIYVQDITRLRTAPAGKDFTSPLAASVTQMAQKNNAFFAASGDYYAHSLQALVIRNGVSYNDRPSTRFQSCVLFQDGTMDFFAPEELDVPALLAAGAWQGWTFGPSLLSEDGQPLTSMPSTYIGVNDRNPRCMLGYFEPGHYCIVVADGRQPSQRYSNGLTLLELSQLASDLGCTKAYNLDGGQSAQIYWQGGVYNHPSGGGRSISDIIYFSTPDAP